MTDQQPKRRYKRIPANLVANIKGTRVNTAVLRQVEEKITNISLGGVYVETPNPFDEGTLVYLSFCVPNSPKEVNVQGLVRWKNMQKKPLGMGIEFIRVELSDKDNIRNYLKKRIKTEIESVPELINCLGDADPIIRKSAVFALKKLSGLDFGQDAALWKDWYESERKDKEEETPE